MKNTIEELTAIMSELVSDNGTEPVLAALLYALQDKCEGALIGCKDERTARQAADEWERQAKIIETAHRSI